METVVLVLCWLGVLQSLLLGLYFLSSAPRNRSHLFLGIGLLLIGVRAAKSTLFIFSDFQWEFVFNIGFAAHAAIGPTMLFYVWSLKKDTKWKKIHWFHFIPAILIVLSAAALTLDNFWYIGGYGVLLYYTLIYIGLYSFEFYRNFKNNSLKTGISVPWVLILIGTITLFQVAYFSNYILGLTAYSAAPVLYSIILYFITFVVLKNNTIFQAEVRRKYQNLKLSKDELENFRTKILAAMDIQQPFLDTNFSLQKLSTLTSIPQHLLSHTFSMVFKESFTNFINRYRIEESKRILRDPEKEYLSIAGIAFECGFNSLSSFNVSFKKNIGITPSEFKKAPNKIRSKALRYI